MTIMRNKAVLRRIAGSVLLSVSLLSSGMTVFAEEVPAETQVQEQQAQEETPPAAETSGTPHDVAGADIADFPSAVAFYGDTAGNYTYDIEVPGATVKEIHVGGKKMTVSTDSNLREGPSADTASKLVMSTGTVVNVLAYTDNEWDKVFFIQETPGEGEGAEPVRTFITGYVKSTLLAPAS